MPVDHPAAYHEDIAAIVAEFEATTLPYAVWRLHATHLHVALWYILHLPAGEAIERICQGIQRYNLVQGTLQTRTGGYQETLTLAFIHLIRHFAARTDRERPFAEIAGDLVRDLPDHRFVLHYYSKALIDSWTARTGWVEPDLQPLPPL